MSNYITDPAQTLPNWPKANFQLRPEIPILQKATASDWNAYLQAITDIQGFLRGAPWLAVVEQGSDPAPSGVSKYIWVRSSDHAVMYNGSPVAGGSGGSASVAVANGAGATGTKALSSEGTVDWFFCTGNNIAAGNWNAQGYNITHTKLTGGSLAAGSYGRVNGASVTGGTYGATFTSTAADDSTAVALSSNAMLAIFGTQLAFGWVVRIP